MVASDPKNHHQPWTTEQDALLREAWEAGWKLKTIGQLMERTTASVGARARVICLPLRQDGGLRSDAWLPGDDEKILRLRRSGWTTGEIARMVGRTSHAVNNRFARLRAEKRKS